jgi:uncharacterized protein YjeT (DUF2065 family)
MSGGVFTALALVLVFEGLLPFLSPATWRNVMQRVLQMSDGQLRFLGLCAVAGGLVALVLLG